MEEVGSALQTLEGNEISAINWKQLAIQHQVKPRPFEAHFKTLLQIDPKPNDSVRDFALMCQKMQSDQSIVVSSDSLGVISFFYGGVFLLAKIDLS